MSTGVTTMEDVKNQKSDSEVRKAEGQMEDLTTSTNRKLMTCTTVFPFTFFPTTIRVDRNKVDLIYRNFFWSKEVFTILIGDLKIVELGTDPFFASLRFEIQGFEQNPQVVRFLPKSCGVEMQKVLMGLIAATREDVDLEALEEGTVYERLKKIGDARG